MGSRATRATVCVNNARASTSTQRVALRPEHHPRSDQSGHVDQPACRTRCPKEPHAQRSWHLQRSPPAQSEDLPPEEWLAESLQRRAARRRARANAATRSSDLLCSASRTGSTPRGSQLITQHRGVARRTPIGRARYYGATAATTAAVGWRPSPRHLRPSPRRAGRPARSRRDGAAPARRARCSTRPR